MSACGSCPSCSSGVPVCVGGICVAPEEALIHGSFLFATFAALFNCFVARRDAVKKNLSGNMRLVLFFVVPVAMFAVCVQMEYIEIPTMRAIKNTIYGVDVTDESTEEPTDHGHSHGHAEWHQGPDGGHIGHFHE